MRRANEKKNTLFFFSIYLFFSYFGTIFVYKSSHIKIMTP